MNQCVDVGFFFFHFRITIQISLVNDKKNNESKKKHTMALSSLFKNK
jgi:hypothetical protein